MNYEWRTKMPLGRNVDLILTTTRHGMNYEWNGKTIWKKIRSKN